MKIASLFFVFNSCADTARATIETRETRLDKPFAFRRPSVRVAIGARADAYDVVDVVIIVRSVRGRVKSDSSACACGENARVGI